MVDIVNPINSARQTYDAAANALGQASDGVSNAVQTVSENTGGIFSFFGDLIGGFFGGILKAPGNILSAAWGGITGLGLWVGAAAAIVTVADRGLAQKAIGWLGADATKIAGFTEQYGMWGTLAAAFGVGAVGTGVATGALSFLGSTIGSIFGQKPDGVTNGAGDYIGNAAANLLIFAGGAVALCALIDKDLLPSFEVSDAGKAPPEGAPKLPTPVVAAAKPGPAPSMPS
jgi:hypothetical protein